MDNAAQRTRPTILPEKASVPAHNRLFPALAIIAAGIVSADPATDTAVPASPGVSTVTQDAVAAGVLTCARRINDLTNYLTQGATSGSVLTADPKAPDRHATSISLEIAGRGQSAYASATFSPVENGCDAVYDAVIWWPESCSDVARKRFPGLAAGKPVKQQLVPLDGGPGLKVFLMPAGTGCISIKKEIARQGP